MSAEHNVYWLETNLYSCISISIAEFVERCWETEWKAMAAEKQEEERPESDVEEVSYGRPVSVAERETLVTVFCYQLLCHTGSNSIH